MQQLGLLFALQVLGATAGLACGLSTWLGQATGFLVGLALAVVLAVPVLLLGQFTAPVMGGVLVATLISLAWIARPSPRVVLTTVLWALGFTAVCAPFVVEDFSVMTYDSHVFIGYAGKLRDSHAFTFGAIDFHSRGIFQIVGHAFAVFTGDTFLTALTPAFSISVGATFAVALDRALRDQVSPRTRWIAIAVVVLAIFAIPMVRLHVVFIHTNWASAGYWFVFAALCYLAEAEQDRRYLPLAFLALLAYALNRVENPMFSAVFLAIAVAATRFERRALAVPLLAFTALLVGWLIVVISVIPADSLHLTPTKALLMIGALVAVAIACFLREVPAIRRLMPAALPAISIASAVGVLALVVIRFDAFQISFANWQGDLWLRPYWGFVTWPVVVILTVWSLWIEHPPHARAVRYSLALFFLLVILLTALAPAGYYGTGRYADLNRITLHVVPLLGFYLALVWIPVVAARLRR